MALRHLLALAGLIGCQCMTIDWSDCGNKDTSFRVMSLSPTTFDIGKPVTLTASGMAAKDITGGTFKLAGTVSPAPVVNGSGSACDKAEIDLPDGAGKVAMSGFHCPVSSGDATLKIDVTLEAANLQSDRLDIIVGGEDGHGRSLLCLIIHGVKEDNSAGLPPGTYKTLFKSYTYSGMDSTSHTIDVWYPVGSAGQKFPFISYSHGNTAGGRALPGDYGVLLSTMSAYGYIIAAHESCNSGCAHGGTLPFDPPGFATMYKEQLKVIDWAKQQGGAGDAVFKNANFGIGVGISGHSMGGQATVYSSSSYGSGHGIKAAVMHHAFTHSYPPPIVPFLAFTGSADIIAFPSQTEGFFNAKGADPIRGRVNKQGATHFEPNPLGGAGAPRNLGMWSAAWFKVFLDETPQEGGVDYKALIFGTASDSLCHGGDGAMTKCDVYGGHGPSPGPSPPAPPSPPTPPAPPAPPAPTPPAPPAPFSCDQCEAKGYKADKCNCGVCGSWGFCTFSCKASDSHPACSKSLVVV